MGFVNELKKNKYRAWKSFCTGLTFAIMGLRTGIIGPTMLDLQLLVDTTVDQITHILPVRAFGGLMGSVTCGFTLHHLDHQIVLLVTLFLSSVGLFLIPFARSLNQLFAVLFFSGFTGGYLINCGNIYILHQWGKENGPFMQMIHFSFGLGAFIAPFIAEPFLKPIEELVNFDNFTSDLNNEVLFNQTYIKKSKSYVDPDTLQVKYSYYFTSCLGFLVFIIFLVTYLKNTSNEPHPTRETGVKKHKDKVKNKETNQELNLAKLDVMKLEEVLESTKNVEKKPKLLKKYHKYLFISLGTIFIHLIYGIELSFGSLLPTFAVKSDLHLSKAAASYVSSLYWGCFTFSRLFAMVMVNYFSSKTVLILELILIMIGNIFLLPLGNIYEWALLLGSSFLGFGVSSAYPSWWGFMEQTIPVTSKITSLFSVSSCLGEFVLPVLIGKYIETWPIFYIYVVFVYSLLASIVFAICCYWEYVINKHKNSS